MSSIGGLGAGASQFLQPFYRPPAFGQQGTNGDNTLLLNDLLTASGSQGAGSANAQQGIQNLFAAIDTNGDGSLSTTEKAAFNQKLADSQNALGFLVQTLTGGQNAPSNDNVFAATDTNGDGSVSLAELSNDPAAKSASSDGLQKLFNLIDTNGDGSISKTESSNFLDAVKTAVAQKAHQGHHHRHQDGDAQTIPASSGASAPGTASGLYSAALGAYQANTPQATPPQAPDLLATLKSILSTTA